MKISESYKGKFGKMQETIIRKNRPKSKYQNFKNGGSSSPCDE
jgi:hypothetical protein